MFGIIKEDRLQAVVRETVTSVMEDAQKRVERDLDGLKTMDDLRARITKYREEIETLRIEKGRREEEIGRKEREIEHKVGLERKRQEFEVEQAKRETELSIREGNLKADRERFEQQMEFHRERLEKEVESLRNLTEKLLQRLPTAEIIANFAPRQGGPDGE